ncbi:MAG: hypothetical protein WCS65_06390 [Verrucomicrobiae bacterium]
MKPPCQPHVRDMPRLLAFRSPLSSFRFSSAFTLIELLVAATISMFLVGLLLMAVQGISTSYTRTQANITRQGDAAFALDQVVQDLEGYVVPNFAAGEAIRATPETVGETTNAIWLTLLSTAVDADNSNVNGTNNFSGATRAISYRLAYQNTISTNSPGTDPTFAIYRSISSAKHTFANVSSATTNMQSQYWGSIAASPSPAPPAPTAIGNFLAENVVGFSVRFLYLDSSGAEKWTSSSDVVRIGRDGATINGAAIAGGLKRAEVSLTILSPEGAQRLKAGLPLSEAISRYGKTSVRQTAFF